LYLTIHVSAMNAFCQPRTEECSLFPGASVPLEGIQFGLARLFELPAMSYVRFSALKKFCHIMFAAAVLALANTTNAASPGNAPPLPITGNRIVNVATESQLQTAMGNLQSGDTILLTNGTYNLISTLYINGRNNVPRRKLRRPPHRRANRRRMERHRHKPLRNRRSDPVHRHERRRPGKPILSRAPVAVRIEMSTEGQVVGRIDCGEMG
jgi:hypothetical protein